MGDTNELSYEIDRALKRYYQAKNAEPAVRTPHCPSDEDLRLLCYEKDEKGALRQQYLDHVIFCKYCATNAKTIIQDKLDKKNLLSKF